jgi:hypothetical protein
MLNTFFPKDDSAYEVIMKNTAGPHMPWIKYNMVQGRLNLLSDILYC